MIHSIGCSSADFCCSPLVFSPNVHPRSHKAPRLPRGSTRVNKCLDFKNGWNQTALLMVKELEIYLYLVGESPVSLRRPEKEAGKNSGWWHYFYYCHGNQFCVYMASIKLNSVFMAANIPSIYLHNILNTKLRGGWDIFPCMSSIFRN